MLRNVFISSKKSFMLTTPVPVNFLKKNNSLPTSTSCLYHIINIYLPEFGLWRPPLLLAGQLWTPAEKEQESHMFIEVKEVVFSTSFGMT